MTAFTKLIQTAAVALTLIAPCYAEVDHLDVYVRTLYPPEVKTVREAATYLLESTDYRLITTFPAPTESREMADATIPPLARLPRTMSITDALLVLIGPDNWLVVDRENKLVSFARSPE